VSTCIDSQVLLEFHPPQYGDVEFSCFVFGLSSMDDAVNITVPDTCDVGDGAGNQNVFKTFRDFSQLITVKRLKMRRIQVRP